MNTGGTGLNGVGRGLADSSYVGRPGGTSTPVAPLPFVNVKDYGAKGDCVNFTGAAAIAASATALTVTGAAFTAADQGKLIYVRGAGAAGAVLATSIQTVTDATHVVVAVAASTTVTVADCYFGSDDTAAIQAALNSGVAAVVVSPGRYLSGPFTVPTRTRLSGMGELVTEFVRKANGTGAFISLASDTAELVTLEGFSVDGERHFQTDSTCDNISLTTTTNGPTQLAASVYNSNDPALRMWHILSRDAKGNGITTAGRGACQSGFLRVYNCDGHGIHTNNFDSFWTTVEIGAAGLHGWWVDSGSGNTRITNAKVFYSGQVDSTSFGDGLVVRGNHCQISSFEVQNAGRRGCLIYNSTGHQINGLYIEFPSTPLHTGNDGLTVQDVTDSTIVFTAIDPTVTGLGYGVTVQLLSTGCTGLNLVGNVRGALSGAYRTIGQTLAGNVVQLNGQERLLYGVANTWQMLTTGEETIPREQVTSTASLGGSGTLKLTYFVARKTETTTQVRMYSGGTASTGLTLARIGLYSVDSSGNLTLVASTASDTTLFGTASTAYTRSWQSSYAKVAGQMYALGTLLVGTTMGTSPGANSGSLPNAEYGQSPVLGSFLSGQSDLPASVTFSSISATPTGQRYYGVVLP